MENFFFNCCKFLAIKLTSTASSWVKEEGDHSLTQLKTLPRLLGDASFENLHLGRKYKCTFLEKMYHQ